jgi:predicted nuclease of predicted toxin-antitoxin system
VRILLDENLPEGLIDPLRELGHVVDSIGSLKLKGLDNGRLYREVAARYDLFFTKDRDFADGIKTLVDPAAVKVILTVIRQMPQRQFVATFMTAFSATEWSAVPSSQEWPVG